MFGTTPSSPAEPRRRHKSGDGLGRLGRLGPSVTFALIVLVNTIMWAVDDVWYTRIGHKMQGYEYAVMSVLYPISYSLMIWPIVLLLMRRGHIPRASRRFPVWKVAVIAAMSQVADLMGFFPVSHLGGAIQTVIGTNIPETMVMSLCIVGARYKWQHVLGAAIIIGGIALSVEESLSHTKASKDMALWVAMLLAIRLIPATVLEEKWLKEHDTSVWYYKALESLFEIVFGLCLIVTVFIHIPGTPDLTPSELPSYFGDAVMCFFGVGTKAGNANGDHCSGTWLLWIPFMILDILTDIVVVLITKHYSAATGVVVSAVVLPAQTLLFQVHFVAGVVTQDGLAWYMVVGLILVCCGIIVYRSAPEVSHAAQVRPPSLARPSSSAFAVAGGAGHVWKPSDGEVGDGYAAYRRMSEPGDAALDGDAETGGGQVRRVSIAMSRSASMDGDALKRPGDAEHPPMAEATWDTVT